jgi:hypothetical protein
MVGRLADLKAPGSRPEVNWKSARPGSTHWREKKCIVKYTNMVDYPS